MSLMVLLTSFSNAYAENSFLCVSDKEKGLSYDKTKEEWVPTDIGTTKYLIKTTDQLLLGGRSKTIKYGLFFYGNDYPFALSNEAVASYDENHVVLLEGFINAEINLSSLKFNVSTPGSYLNSNATGLRDDSAILFGTCSKL